MANTTSTPFMQRSDGGLFKALVDARFCSGNVFFVNGNHSNSGDSAGRGQTPDAPLDTLDYAIGLCTADNDDVIIVLPGHTETVTGTIAVDVAGIKIVGIGEGRRRPRITFGTNATAGIDVSAARCVLENLVLISNVDDQTIMVEVTASDFVCRGCHLELGNACVDAECGIDLDASSDRAIIEDCTFHIAGNTTVTKAIDFDACDSIVIRGCNIMGYFGTAGAIVNAAAAVNVLIAGNVIVNRTADGNNKTIVLHASTVGAVVNNRSAIIDSACPAPFTCAAAFVGGNYSAAAAGVTAGTLI